MGAERIRGELLDRLGIEVSKRTIQKYLPKARKSRSSSNLGDFLANQARCHVGM